MRENIFRKRAVIPANSNIKVSQVNCSDIRHHRTGLGNDHNTSVAECFWQSLARRYCPDSRQKEHFGPLLF